MSSLSTVLLVFSPNLSRLAARAKAGAGEKATSRVRLTVLFAAALQPCQLHTVAQVQSRVMKHHPEIIHANAEQFANFLPFEAIDFPERKGAGRTFRKMGKTLIEDLPKFFRSINSVSLIFFRIDPGEEFGVSPSTLNYWQEEAACAR